MARRQKRDVAASEPPSDPEEVARTIALQQLTVKPRTRAELATTLRRRGIPDDAAARVLERLEGVRLIDDEAYAQAWVESRHAGRGLARRALAHELRDRGVDRQVVDSAVEAVSPDDELVAARALVDRKLRSTQQLETAARVRRLAGMLARKGYSSAVAFRVVREAIAEERPTEIRRRTDTDVLARLDELADPDPGPDLDLDAGPDSDAGPD